MGNDGKMSDGRRLRLIRGLYDRVKPGFPCKSGCFECCKTIVQMLRVEWDHLKKLPIVKELVDGGKSIYEEHNTDTPELVRIVDERGWCPFISTETGKCAVYGDRPMTCRIYAQHFALACEQGVECPDEIHVTQDTFVRMRKLAGFEELGDARPEEEAQAMRQAIGEWRKKQGSFVALPRTDADRAVIRKRVSEILGRELE